jgi:hypothetical protein
MAKRRKKQHTSRRRSRRRMSGITAGFGSDVMEIIGLVAGSVAATVAQRQLTSVNAKLISAGEIVGGHMLKKHGKSPFMVGVGFGLMSAGAIGLTHELGVIHGVEDFVSGMYGGEMTSQHELSGFRNNQFIGEAGMAGLANEAHVGDMDEMYLNEM